MIIEKVRTTAMLKIGKCLFQALFVPTKAVAKRFLEVFAANICNPLQRGNSKALTKIPLEHSDEYRMIRRRSIETGISSCVGNHSFRATGIAQYLEKDDEVAVDEVERILI